jgi:hypothetical protein
MFAIIQSLSISVLCSRMFAIIQSTYAAAFTVTCLLVVSSVGFSPGSGYSTFELNICSVFLLGIWSSVLYYLSPSRFVLLLDRFVCSTVTVHMGIVYLDFYSHSTIVSFLLFRLPLHIAFWVLLSTEMEDKKICMSGFYHVMVTVNTKKFRY